MKRIEQKKLLAIVLTVVLLVGMFPAVVSATGIVTTTTEESLRQAIEEAVGTKENPEIIQVEQNIEFTKSLVIPREKHVKLIGGEDGIVFSLADSFIGNSLIEVGTEELDAGSLFLENITMDCEKKVRGILVHHAKHLETQNVIIKNALCDGSGGGIMVQWGNGDKATINLNDTEIYNCEAPKYGGAIGSYNAGIFTLNNVYFHNNSANWNGASGYTSTIILKGKVVTGSEESQRQEFFGCDIILADKLFDGSKIELGTSLENTKALVEGGDGYRITLQDLEKFSLVNVVKNNSNIAEDYMLYLDEEANAIKFAPKIDITFNANNGDDSEVSMQKVLLGVESTLDSNIFIREGYIFDGWNTQSDGEGTTYKNCAEVTFSQDTELYAMWRALDAVPKELATEYSSEISIPVSDNVIVLKNLTSSDASIVSVNDGKLKAEHVGEAVITATATTENGGEAEVKINVKVTPMLITYGSTGDDVIGWDHTYNRPAVAYSQPVGENEEQLSDHIWFYPAKESVDADSGEKIYIPDTEVAHIELEQGRDFTFSYTQNDYHVESTGVLPFLETLDSEGNSEAIDVIVDMQNENYQFVTIGTLWKPWDQILLRVTVMAEGMERISMMNGDELLQNSLEKRILEYTGEGVAPAYDLTGISAEDIGEFTVHFHSVIEGISYDTHLYNKQPAELSVGAVQAVAPKELGVYSMVVNGQNDETKKYAYVSRRFEITKGNPAGEPEFDAVDSSVELSAIELSGSMKNAAGKPVEGVFEWIDDSQTVEQGAGYAWRFIPDDTEHYNIATGESVVYPEEKPGSDKEDLAALIQYAQDAKKDETYKYLVPKVKELFEKALEDAIAVNAKEDATQKEIDAAYDALLAKVHLLDFTGNTESLTVLVGTASGKVEEMYTKESWAPFAEALEAAREVLADANALQAEIDTAREVLQAAMNALVEKPIDTTKLEKLVADASVYEENLENYIPSTTESFTAALDGAREVLVSSDITQDAVDSAYATLLQAIFGLREAPNKERLEDLLGEVEAMDLSAYSEETAKAVKVAVAMAAVVMEDENANQNQVDAAVTALEEAVAGLETKEEVGTGDINTDNTEDTSKEDDSSVTDKKVASNDEGSKDTANKTTTAKTNAKTAAQTGDAAKAAVPAVATAAALLVVWFVWKKK